MLVGATNPCPCGHAGEVERCRCSEADLARYRRKLSGPLLDRIDLLVHVAPQRAARPGRRPIGAGQDERAIAQTTSAQARVAVVKARERQLARFADQGIGANAHMDVKLVRQYTGLDARGEAMLCSAQERGLLSVRGTHRTMRVARTVADLNGSERVRAEHVAAALAFRPEVVLGNALAA
jgi:magnesium chelatase family protein